MDELKEGIQGLAADSTKGDATPETLSKPDQGAQCNMGSSANGLANAGKGVRNELLNLLSLSTARTRDDYQRLAFLSASLTLEELAAAKEWKDNDTAEVNALLAEYGTLRQETMNTINNRTQILMLGLAAIAALAGGTLTSDRLTSSKLLVAAVFSGAIPLVCVFVLLVWMSEAIRCHRVSYYLASAVEARINAKLGRLTVTWEAALWTVLPRDELWGPSMMALALVGVFAAAAPWLGVLVTGTPIALQGRPLYEVFVPYAFYGLTVLYSLRYMPRLKNIPIVRSEMHSRG